MDGGDYVEGRRSVKAAFALWWLCLAALVLMENYEVPHIFDPVTLVEPPQRSLWYVLIVVWTFSLMWIGGGYLFYFGFTSIRHGKFPPNIAIYPISTKQRRGFLAYLGGAALIVTAIGFFCAPIVLNIISNREVSRTLQIHQKLVEEGVLSPNRQADRSNSP